MRAKEFKMLIDTHSHINHEKLTERLPEILAGLNHDRVGAVICPSYSLESMQSALKVADNSRVACALGIHPENCTEFNDDVRSFLRENLIDRRVVAVGEIGLDYHYGMEQKDLQHCVLTEQMAFAHEFDLPIIFHVRDAWQDFFEIVRENRDLVKRGVVHCFEGDSEIAKTLLDLGLFISVTGLVTFKHRDALREAIKIIPLDRLMCETDAPYLTSEPFRHLTNEPKYTALVADKIAEIKGIEPSEVDKITTENAFAFFDRLGGKFGRL